MRNIVTLLLGIILSNSLLGQCNQNNNTFDLPQIVINEVHNGSASAGDEYFELLVIGAYSDDGTLLKLPDIILDDNHYAGPNKGTEPGHIVLKSSCLSNLKPGDIVLVYGEGATSGGDQYTTSFRIDDPCIERWEALHNLWDSYQNRRPYTIEPAQWKHLLPLRDDGDIAQIRTSSGQIQEVIIDQYQNYSLEGPDLSNYTHLSNTPGLPNSVDNANFIDELRSIFPLRLTCENSGNNEYKVKIAGGQPPYSLSSENIDPSQITLIEENTFQVSNLECGSYLIEVLDENGCSEKCEILNYFSESITIESCPGALVTLDIPACTEDALCYKWTPEDRFSNIENSQDQNQISLRFYQNDIIEVYISDGNGNIIGTIRYGISMTDTDLDGDGICDANDPDPNNTCIPNNELTFDIQGDRFSCEKSKLSVASGDNILWSTGETGIAIEVYESNTYSVTITDNDGCSGSAEASVMIENSVNAAINGDLFICANETSVLTASGGSTFSWSNGSTQNAITAESSGIYSVTITSSSGCTGEASVEVIQDPTPDNDGDGECESTDPDDTDPCSSSNPLTLGYEESLSDCSSQLVLINLSIDNAEIPVELFLIFQDGSSVSNTTSNTSFSFEMNPEESVQMTVLDANNCSGYLEFTSSPINSNDTDGDGICDVLDCDIANPNIGPGLPCNDNDYCTYNDVYDSECQCVGIPIPDCDACEENQPCDDGDFCTTDDRFNEYCDCIGTPIPDCGGCVIGSPCDDGNDCTTNDEIDANCNCNGTLIPGCNGCVAGNDCDDSNPCTSNDKFDADCNCVGVDNIDPTIVETYNDPCISDGIRILTINEAYDSYRWFLDGAIVGYGNSIEVSTSGDYEVLIADGACYNTILYTVDEHYLNQIEISASESIICDATSGVTLTINNTINSPTWYDNENNPIGTGPSLNITSAGVYNVIGQNNNGCDVHGSIEIDAALQEIAIYPREPKICDRRTGVTVNCFQDWDHYTWKHLVTNTVVFEGADLSEVTIRPYGPQLATLPFGLWELTVHKTNLDGTICSQVVEFEVIDLKDPIAIDRYFLKKGFYKVPIWRDEAPPGLIDDTNTSRTNLCTLSEIRFAPTGDVMDISTPILNDVVDGFKPIEIFEGKFMGSNNTCLCSEEGLSNLEEYEEQFSANTLTLWTHLSFDNDLDLEGYEYIKAQMPNEPSLPVKDDDINFDQFTHLASIQSDIIASNTLYDQVKSIHRNVFMARPIGGFLFENTCDFNVNFDLNKYLISPAGIPFLLDQTPSKIAFSDTNQENIQDGTCLEYTIGNYNYKAYYLTGSDVLFGGYYDGATSHLADDLPSINNIQSVDAQMGISGCQGCQLEAFDYQPEDIDVGLIDGGYQYELRKLVNTISLSDDGLFDVFSQKEANEIIYKLLCNIRALDPSNPANNVFEFPTELLNTVVIGRDINLQGVHYPYLILTIPDDASNVTLEASQYENNVSIVGFENSLRMSDNPNLRLVAYNNVEGKKDDFNWRRIRFVSDNVLYFDWEDRFTRIECKMDFSAIKTATLLPIYAKGIENSENLLLFVNGYRDNGPTNINSEYPNSTNIVNPCNDHKEGGVYWDAVGNQFINRIQNYNVIYADGHHTIETSNHIFGSEQPKDSKIHFAKGIVNCLGEANIRIPHPYLPYVTGSPFNCQLDDTPNILGFMERYAAGENAGENLWAQIQTGIVKVKMNNDNTKIKGKIDIVAHSMGFAYAAGMTNYLKQHIEDSGSGKKFGRLYILAPENACSTPPEFVLNDFEEVWQYGSHEVEDIDYEQDGIAPQCAVPGLEFDSPSDVYGRIRFLGLEKHKNFLDAHYGANYGWVLSNISNQQKGYVKKR